MLSMSKRANDHLAHFLHCSETLKIESGHKSQLSVIVCCKSDEIFSGYQAILEDVCWAAGGGRLKAICADQYYCILNTMVGLSAAEFHRR